MTSQGAKVLISSGKQSKYCSPQQKNKYTHTQESINYIKLHTFAIEGLTLSCLTKLNLFKKIMGLVKNRKNIDCSSFS